ncbi:RHS repeat domain-containing protein [Cellvibrio sp. BR]|uniref:RHS repeat domain-containing protein n=1 Tax=Cellvibrio sp. BR TaxID=1134474 RepID=UPI0009D9E2B4|nr:RHS repeat domain-containing protein [Cellvibrio sp. BR]
MSKRQNTVSYRHLLHFQTYKAYTLLLILSLFSCCLHAADTTAYTYDALGRLVGVKQNGAIKEGYQYDKAGNRCSTSSTQIVADAYCVQSNPVESYSGSWGVVTAYHDSDGTFQLNWTHPAQTNLISISEFQIIHIPPSGVRITTNEGLSYSKSYSNLALGRHSIGIYACGVESYDDDEYEILGCDTRSMVFDITVQ